MRVSPFRSIVLLLGAAALIAGGVFAARRWLGHASANSGHSEKFRATTIFRIYPITVSEPSDNWFVSQYQEITSRETLLVAAKDLKLGITWDTTWNLTPDETAAKLERVIELEQERGMDVVALHAWSDNADQAAYIANGVRRAYEERRTAMERERREKQTEVQELATERARRGMLHLMLKRPGTWRPPLSRIVEENLLSDQARLFALKELKGEPFVMKVLEFSGRDDAIQNLYRDYRRESDALAALQKEGRRQNHSKLEGLRESVAAKFKRLETPCEVYRSDLKERIEKSQRDLESRKSYEAARTRESGRDFAKAKSAFETQLKLLNSIREHNGRPSQCIEVLEEATAPAISK